MITLRNVAKSIGGIRLVDDVNLNVPAGQGVCLTGPSGVGKTTLLELAAGIIPPDRGEVSVKTLRRGCVFQDDVLVPWLTAIENVTFALGGSDMEPADARESAKYWLQRYQLSEDMKPNRMSGGMRRRLNLARAMAVSPQALFLDEPFAFLDQEWQETVEQDICECTARDCAVLMISHQLERLDSFHFQVLHIANAPLCLPDSHLLLQRYVTP